MTITLRPAAGWELPSLLAPYLERGNTIEIVGSGSKRAVGRPERGDVKVSTASMRGTFYYDSDDLVMGAHSGTAVAQIEADLAGRGQMLPFEPLDIGPATGGSRNTQTIGAAFASDSSGPRSFVVGGCRDHLLGLEAVNGRGEVIRSGGRTSAAALGLNLGRLLAGSWGTLACLTQVVFKVQPMPEDAMTLVYHGLIDELAIELMRDATRGDFNVTGAAHLTTGTAGRLATADLTSGGGSLTVIRIEQSRSLVIHQAERLTNALAVYGKPLRLDFAETFELWSELRRLSVMPFDEGTALWNIKADPRDAATLVRSISRHVPVEAYYDWAGGQIWLEVPARLDAGEYVVRRATSVCRGDATLIRAAASVRDVVDVFQPQPPAIQALASRVKQAFDPLDRFSPGRMTGR
ncbi:MAG: FAD-binding protein [Pseudomonadota bacterium]